MTDLQMIERKKKTIEIKLKIKNQIQYNETDIINTNPERPVIPSRMLPPTFLKKKYKT